MASFWGPSRMCDSSSWNFSSSSTNRVELGLPSTSITPFFWSGSSQRVGGAATPASEIPHGPATLNMQRQMPRLDRPGQLVMKRQALKGQEITEDVQCHVDDPQEPVFGARRAGAKRGPHLQ